MDHIFYKKCFFLRLLVLRDSSTHPILVVSSPWLSTDLLSQSSWSESDRQKASYPPQYALREKNSAVLQQPLYKLLTQRLCSVIEAAIFPWRLTRSLPLVPCRNQLHHFDESMPFISLNCPIKGWFLSFIVLIRVPQENMNFTPVWFCLLVTFSRSFAATQHRESGQWADNAVWDLQTWGEIILVCFRRVATTAFNNSDFSGGVFRFLYCVAICWTKLNSHTYRHVSTGQFYDSGKFCFNDLCQSSGGKIKKHF